MLLSGPLMMAVAVAFVIGWVSRSRTPLRWFWAGAGIWAVGVALKALVAVLLNRPILSCLEAQFPHPAYLGLGSVYIGVLTGVFEVGITLLAACIWRSLANNGPRAVAVGIGAGAFEALLLGMTGIAAVVVALSDLPSGETVRGALAVQIQVTPLPWLAGPVERIIAILCHTSSRTLVLLSVATRRQSLFWAGFLVLTAIDSIAGWVHISGSMGKINLWWIELALAPFAVASIPIIRWCLAKWPRIAAPAEVATLEAVEPEAGDAD
jgi:uncharacterized membrane protein YhfC